MKFVVNILYSFSSRMLHMHIRKVATYVHGVKWHSWWWFSDI